LAENSFRNAYVAAATYCLNDAKTLHFDYVTWQKGQAQGFEAAIGGMAKQAYYACSLFMGINGPYLPPATTPTEQKLIDTYTDIQLLFMDYANWVTTDLQSGGTDHTAQWYTHNEWYNLWPTFHARLVHYSALL
jgi:hypothetical protein